MSDFHWHPTVVLSLEGLLALYLAGVGPLRRRHRWGPPPAPRQIWAFVAALLVLAAALLGPLAEWAERRTLSAHMAQHLLLLFVAPVLLLAGTPAWLLRPLLSVPGLGRAGYRLTRPAMAFAVTSAVQVLWHLPPLFGLALEREWLHASEHVTFVASAVLLWWPVLGPLPEWPRPAPPAQLLYLFLLTVPMMAIAAPLTLAEETLYPFYARAAPVAWLAPQADQELAGILMWLGGMLGYLVAGTVVFFRWALPASREEQAVEAEEAAHGHA